MAQKHASHSAGAGDFEFAAALAACLAGGWLDCSIGGAGMDRDNGVVAPSVVSGLLPFLNLGRVLVKPMGGARGSGADICHFNNASGTDHACAGQRPFAPQALANRAELLAAGKGRRFARPIILAFSMDMKQTEQRDIITVVSTSCAGTGLAGLVPPDYGRAEFHEAQNQFKGN